MRLTRHARNRARLYALTHGEIYRVLTGGATLAPDRRGNPRRLGRARDGRQIVVVVALDNPELVITLIDRSKR